MSEQEEIESRKKRAESGWLVEPPPQPIRDAIPGEENKWFLMMGARYLLEQRQERIRRAARDIVDRYG